MSRRETPSQCGRVGSPGCFSFPFCRKKNRFPRKIPIFKIGKAKKVNRVSKIRVCMCLRYVLKEFLFLSPGG